MVSIVIPVFNEEENVNLLYESLNEESEKWKHQMEVIFVDDASTDNTRDRIIGEYPGRVYLEVKKRPQYIIDEVINHNSGPIGS